jgi:hypothetical protein
VEKASGEQVTLREYLEQVWAAVSKEALNMIFAGADATGLEEDARLTAMWLWTLSTAGGEDDLGSRGTVAINSQGQEEDEEEDSARRSQAAIGWSSMPPARSPRDLAHTLSAWCLTSR